MRNQSPVTNHQSPVTNHQSPVTAIVLHNISKKYSLSVDRPILLKNLFLPQKKEEIWALKNISLSIKKGETIGIIGENGSGKSTLLKIIAGITVPTNGTVEINGRVGSLIELGAGFHHDLTGRENIYLNGTLLGFTKKELDKKYKEIVDFADIGKFIDQPIRTYSSGMVVRLGFSVAVHLDPDILLIDEVLAVGDEEFQGKCIWKFRELTRMKKTIIIASHNLDIIRRICNKTYWIIKGRHIVGDNPMQVVEKYKNEVDAQFHPYKRGITGSKRSSKKISITNLRLFNAKGESANIFKSGDKVSIEVEYKNYGKINSQRVGIVLYSSKGEYLYGFLTPPISVSRNEGSVFFSIPQLALLKGKYPITVAIANDSLSENLDWKEQKIILQVKNEKQNDIFGSIDLRMKFNDL